MEIDLELMHYPIDKMPNILQILFFVSVYLN